MPRRRDGDAVERQAAELEQLRPYLGLAREIKAHVDQALDDEAPSAESIVAAIDAVPTEERRRLVREAFARLAPDQQWELLVAAFGDEEIRAHLAEERARRREWLERQAAAHAVVRDARVAGRLATTHLPPGTALVLGLFRPADARAAVRRGREASTCARRLELRATEVPGELQVLSDVFDPQRALFVTSDYDEATWRAERVESHARVRLGSLTGGTAPELEPWIYPGGRVDLVLDDEVRKGRLHLGFAVVGDEDVFADGS